MTLVLKLGIRNYFELFFDLCQSISVIDVGLVWVMFLHVFASRVD